VDYQIGSKQRIFTIQGAATTSPHEAELAEHRQESDDLILELRLAGSRFVEFFLFTFLAVQLLLLVKAKRRSDRNTLLNALRPAPLL
jgi:hypothetical protein